MKNKKLAFFMYIQTCNEQLEIMYLAFTSDYVVNASNLRIHRCARLNHTLRCSRAIISRTEIVPGPCARGGSITIVAALLREKMQNCRRERSLARSLGCIKSGVVIYRNSCGQSPARAESLLVTHLQKTSPSCRRETPRESAMIVAITRARIYFKIATSPFLFKGKIQSIRTSLDHSNETFTRNRASKRRCELSVAYDSTHLSHLPPLCASFPQTGLIRAESNDRDHRAF